MSTPKQCWRKTFVKIKGFPELSPGRVSCIMLVVLSLKYFRKAALKWGRDRGTIFEDAWVGCGLPVRGSSAAHLSEWSSTSTHPPGETLSKFLVQGIGMCRIFIDDLYYFLLYIRQ